MNFLEKLDYLMNLKNINKSTLAKESGVPYTTIDAFYKKGYENAKISTIKKLCTYFGVTLDYLIRDDVDSLNYGKNERNVNNKQSTDLKNKGLAKLIEASKDASEEDIQFVYDMLTRLKNKDK